MKVNLDTLDLSWLVTSDNVRGVTDYLKGKLEKMVIDLANGIFKEGHKHAMTYAVGKPNTGDFDSLFKFIWEILLAADKF